MRRSRADLAPRAALLALTAITLAGLCVRLLVDRSIWLDEAISIHQAKLGLLAMIEDLQLSDRHPPLHHLALWASVRVLGAGELAVRAPSILAGTLAIPAGYALARELYDRRCAVAAAALIAVSPPLVWYAQEARMYAFVTLLVLVSTWAQVRAARHGRRADWVLYALATAALLWTHYATVLLVAAQQLAFLALALRRRRDGEPVRALLLGWGAACAFLAWQSIPLGLFALRQFQSTAAASTFAGPAQFGDSASLSFYGVLANGAWALWGYHPDRMTELLAAAWPLMLLVALLALGRGRSWRTVYLLTLVVVPVAGLLAIGTANRDLFEVRYFLGAVPVLLVLLARVATSWTPPGRIRAGAVAALVGSLALGLADQQLNDRNPRLYGFGEALHAVSAQARPGDAVLYEPPDLRFVTEYYAPDLPARPLVDGIPSRRRAERVFVVASFLDLDRFRDRTNRLVGRLGYERREVGRREWPQVRVWEFR